MDGNIEVAKGMRQLEVMSLHVQRDCREKSGNLKLTSRRILPRSPPLQSQHEAACYYFAQGVVEHRSACIGVFAPIMIPKTLSSKPIEKQGTSQLPSGRQLSLQ